MILKSTCKNCGIDFEYDRYRGRFIREWCSPECRYQLKLKHEAKRRREKGAKPRQFKKDRSEIKFRGVSEYRTNGLESQLFRAKCPRCKCWFTLRLYGWIGTGTIYKYCPDCKQEVESLMGGFDETPTPVPDEVKTGVRPAQ